MQRVSILFVDDEANVLSGLRRSLHGYRDRWDMTFALGGHEAIEKMRHQSFDAVISDMKMPGCDGVEVLQAAKELTPEALRSVLSGQSDRGQTHRVLGTAHQFVSKPCDVNSLELIVSKAQQLKARLTEKNIKRIVSGISSLPSTSEQYDRVLQLLACPTPDIDEVAQVVASDIAMSAKVLQLVNSSFFGQPVRTVSSNEATKLLGADLIQYLIQTAKLFRPYEHQEHRLFSLRELTHHSLQVASSARKISLLETQDPIQADEAFMAGLFHDIGKIALADSQPDFYDSAVELANAQQTSLWQAEVHVFGTSHAEVGSYLLALWGLPHVIVDAVACYRQPTTCSSKVFSAATAVHIANTFHRRNAQPDAAAKQYPIECEMLRRSPHIQAIGLESHIPKWCQSLLPELQRC